MPGTDWRSTDGHSTDWPTRARCARPGTDPEAFFPDETAPDYPARVAAAKRVCAGCPVRPACLAEVLGWEQSGHRWGVVAATTPDERDQLELRSAGPGGVAGGAAA